MAGHQARYGRFAALAAASILAACSGGAGGGRGPSEHLADRSAAAGDFETAAALYHQAFEANPQSVDALVGLGRSYAGMGEYARAQQVLTEASRASRTTRACCSRSPGWSSGQGRRSRRSTS